MFISYGTPKNINDLNLSNFHLTEIGRNQIPIVIIDDETFNYLEELRFHKYNVLQLKDIESIEMTKPYEIILCDIKGVGKRFKSKFEGAHVISEIRKVYPFKTILAYTAHQFDASYNKYFNMADQTIKKDISLDDWIDTLDNAIDQTVNPTTRWEKIRDYLLSKNVSLYNITRLENEYVTQIQQKQNLNNFPSKQLNHQLSDDIRAVLASFTASIIFKLIFS